MSLSEDVDQLFNEVIKEISQNIHSIMEELWVNWTHLGVSEDSKINNILKLKQIEKDLHRNVIAESRQLVKNMQMQRDKLKEETEQLSKLLSVEIPVIPQGDRLLCQYVNQLEEQIKSYRSQVEPRQAKFDRLLEWQRDLADELGTTIQELKEVPLPSEEELERLKAHMEVLQAERDKRVETFLNVQIEIKDIMDKLQLEPQNEFEHLVVTELSVDFKVTDLNMDRLAKLQQDLQEKYEQANRRLSELRERLSKLWDRLEEDQTYRENFLVAHLGCHPDTEAAIKEEIKRCEDIKRQKIQVFVANIRTKIKLMWDQLMYSQQEREEFVHYYQGFVTEDTLTLHEMYLNQMTEYYNENKVIFDLIFTRKNLWRKMAELEARASEPGRYNNRGGQLLKEEKHRKAIANKLPKIESEIRRLVLEYESQTGKIFTVGYGEPLLQLMEDEWETRRAGRHKKSGRKQALSATSPLGAAAGSAAIAQKKRSWTKRQPIAGSSNKAVSPISNNLSAMERSNVSILNRRISGHLTALALADDSSAAEIKLDCDLKLKPKIAVNAKVLRNRWMCNRRSIGGKRSSTSQFTVSQEERDPLMDSTLLTTYADFKDQIAENNIGHSSMAVPGESMFHKEVNAPKKPRKLPLTLGLGKENMQQTTSGNQQRSPSNPTTALKLNNDGFATPRAPLNATCGNMQPQHTVTGFSFTTTPNNVSRSNSHLNNGRE